MMEMEQEIRERLAEDIAAWGLSLTVEQADRFVDYARLLLDWNERINLTRITHPAAICRLHFVDSIAPMRFVSFVNRSLIDIGTGAGFPGIPLKIMNPSLSLVLLDALDKRCRFLREVADRLELNVCEGDAETDVAAADEASDFRMSGGVTVLHGRAEDFAAARRRPGGEKEKRAAERGSEAGGFDSLRGSFDFATSRAVARLNILSEYAVPFLKIGGQFIAYKLDDDGAELRDAADALQLLGASFDRRESYVLPETEPAHTLYFLTKTAATPEKYPRRAGMPEKRPL